MDYQCLWRAYFSRSARPSVSGPAKDPRRTGAFPRRWLAPARIARDRLRAIDEVLADLWALHRLLVQQVEIGVDEQHPSVVLQVLDFLAATAREGPPLLPGAGGVLVEFGGTATRTTRQGRADQEGQAPLGVIEATLGYVPPSAPLSACPYPQQEVKGRRGAVAARRFSLAETMKVVTSDDAHASGAL